MLRDSLPPNAASIFTIMTKRIIYLTLLIVSSLIGVLGLQGYFLYSDFQEKSSEFENDINWALETALPEMEKERSILLSKLFKKDIQDSTLIKMERWDGDGEFEGLRFLNPKNGDVVLTYRTETAVHGTKTTEELMEMLYSPMGDDGDMEVVFSLTEEIDARRAERRDTTSIDQVKFRARLTELLGDRSISADYEIRFIHEDSIYLADIEPGIASRRKEASYTEPGYEVMLVFSKPFFNILQRSSALLIASAAVVLLIVVSFVMLMRTINKQRKLSDLKDDFVDNMTHELLTPIATLKIALESLEKPDVQMNADKSQKYLGVSKKELGRVNDIVHNVLYTSLHDQGKVVLNKEEVNLNKLLADLVSYHQNRSDEAVEFEVAWLDDPIIHTDKQQLTNVIHNLIDNAIKYASTEPVKIKIDFKERTGSLDLVISDNGRGIRPEHQDKIFNKFHRAIDTENESIKGLGVGLYYVKSVLTAMGGSIQLLNSSMNGSSFKVSLQK